MKVSISQINCRQYTALMSYNLAALQIRDINHENKANNAYYNHKLTMILIGLLMSCGDVHPNNSVSDCKYH